jgi:hypothetical protein
VKILADVFTQGQYLASSYWTPQLARQLASCKRALRKPQPVAAARIEGFTSENVPAFFDIFEKEMEKINFSPNRPFTVDETGITVVQHRTSRVVALKGNKAVATLSSSERGLVFSSHRFCSSQERT